MCVTARLWASITGLLLSSLSRKGPFARRGSFAPRPRLGRGDWVSKTSFSMAPISQTAGVEIEQQRCCCAPAFPSMRPQIRRSSLTTLLEVEAFSHVLHAGDNPPRSAIAIVDQRPGRGNSSTNPVLSRPEGMKPQFPIQRRNFQGPANGTSARPPSLATRPRSFQQDLD